METGFIYRDTAVNNGGFVSNLIMIIEEHMENPYISVLTCGFGGGNSAMTGRQR